MQKSFQMMQKIASIDAIIVLNEATDAKNKLLLN